MTTTITTQCSGCMADVVLDEVACTVTVHVPSNGLRGSKRTDALNEIGDVWGNEDVAYWDCPVCGHADSYDFTLEA